jgi:hypothetical protein
VSALPASVVFVPPPPAAAAAGVTRLEPSRPPPKCDAAALAEAGRRQDALGQRARALASFEAAFACVPQLAYAEQAFVLSCNLSDLAKARQLWKAMPAASRERTLGACARNRITKWMLESR